MREHYCNYSWATGGDEGDVETMALLCWRYAVWAAGYLNAPSALYWVGNEAAAVPLSSAAELATLLISTLEPIGEDAEDFSGDACKGVLVAGDEGIDDAADTGPRLMDSPALRLELGAILRSDVFLWPQRFVELSVHEDLLQRDQAEKLRTAFSKGLKDLNPDWGFVRTRDAMGIDWDNDTAGVPRVGWLTYLSTVVYPVHEDLKGFTVSRPTAAGTLLELADGPWDPDNQRVMALLAEANELVRGGWAAGMYGTMTCDGPLVPPDHIRRFLESLEDDDDEDDDDEEEDAEEQGSY